MCTAGHRWHVSPRWQLQLGGLFHQPGDGLRPSLHGKSSATMVVEKRSTGKGDCNFFSHDFLYVGVTPFKKGFDALLHIWTGLGWIYYCADLKGCGEAIFPILVFVQRQDVTSLNWRTNSRCHKQMTQVPQVAASNQFVDG